MSARLHVFSGEYDFGPIGVEIGANDQFGKPLHTGDIVMAAHGTYIGSDVEAWHYDNLLSAIVTDPEDGRPFPMGLKGCGFDHPEWRITLVKKFSDVVAGERWPAWGFNYRAVGGKP